MKLWHVIVLDGCRIVEDREKFLVKEANELYEELKKKYAETHPHYAVKREWY
jgi:hypothetical protein